MHGIAHRKRAAGYPISAKQRTTSDTPYIDIAQSFCERRPAYSQWPNSRRLDPDWITKWPRYEMPAAAKWITKWPPSGSQIRDR